MTAEDDLAAFDVTTMTWDTPVVVQANSNSTYNTTCPKLAAGAGGFLVADAPLGLAPKAADVLSSTDGVRWAGTYSPGGDVTPLALLAFGGSFIYSDDDGLALEGATGLEGDRAGGRAAPSSAHQSGRRRRADLGHAGDRRLRALRQRRPGRDVDRTRSTNPIPPRSSPTLSSPPTDRSVFFVYEGVQDLFAAVSHDGGATFTF